MSESRMSLLTKEAAPAGSWAPSYEEAWMAFGCGKSRTASWACGKTELWLSSSGALVQPSRLVEAVSPTPYPDSSPKRMFTFRNGRPSCGCAQLP